MPSTDTPEDERPVVRCAACELVQFITKRGSCRRCFKPLPKPEQLEPPAEIPVTRACTIVAAADTVRHEPAGSGSQLDLVVTLGHRVRDLRTRLKITQEGVCRRSGVSRGYFSRIEAGQMTPTIGTIEKICGAFGISMRDFFSPYYIDSVPDVFVDELLVELLKLSRANRILAFRRMATIGMGAQRIA